MIDIHTHILPGVDDGAANLPEALDMLRKSASQGTNRVIVTPHANTGFKDSSREEILKKYAELCRTVERENVDIEIALGMEVYAEQGLCDLLKDDEVLTLNGSHYLLIENSFSASPEELIDMMELVAQYGKIPVLAHAERFAAVQMHPELAYEWNRRGYGIQINQGSLFGRFGERERKAAHLLMEHNLVQLVATDCHGTSSRTPGLRPAWDYITQCYSKGCAEVLLEINPARVWEDQEILIINPRNPKWS